MSIVDKQRIAAVAMLERLGYTFSLADGWSPHGDTTIAPNVPSTAEADAMHSILVLRADALEGCSEGSREEVELQSIADVIEAYEAKRWPSGRDPGGKG